MSHIDKQIEELEQRVKRLKEKRTKQELLPDRFRLADLLHSIMCHANHVDQCSYAYNSWESWNPDDRLNARSQYVEMAESVLEVIDFKTAIKVFEAICP